MGSELAVINGNQKASPVLFKQFLDSRKEEIGAYASAEISADRFMRLALNCLSNNPKLQDCTLSSVFKAAMEVYELGLEISNSGGEAYLIPYGTSCTFQLGYKGDIALLRRSGNIDDLWAKPVYKNETFELEFGTRPFIKHLPDLDGVSNKDNFRGAYCVIMLRGVSTPHIEYMSKSEIEDVRKQRKGARSGDLWDTNYVRMAVKTVIKRAATQMDIRGKAADAFNRDSEGDGFDYSNNNETTAATTSPKGNDAIRQKIAENASVTPTVTTENAQTTDNGVVDTEFKEEAKTEAQMAEEADAQIALDETRANMQEALAKVMPEGETPQVFLKRVLKRDTNVGVKKWSYEDLGVLGNYILENQPKTGVDVTPDDPDYISCPLHDEFLAAGGTAEKFAFMFPKKSKDVDLLLAFRLLDNPDREKVKVYIEKQKSAESGE
jgi:recombination protein RecT